MLPIFGPDICCLVLVRQCPAQLYKHKYGTLNVPTSERGNSTPYRYKVRYGWYGILVPGRQYIMIWNGMVWYGTVWYGMVWHGMEWYWYGVVWCGMAWYDKAWYGMV